MLLVLLLACSMDQGFTREGNEAPDSPWEGGTDWEDLDTGAAEDPGEDPANDEDDQDDESGEVPPRAPFPGEILLTELMIDPSAVADKAGEWVELRNVGGAALDLSGHFLVDANVDLAELSPTAGDSLVVEPGGYLVLCAAQSANGGVDCDATYVYSTWGDGFALANGGDEVGLLGPEAALLHAMAYAGDQVTAGVSLGLDPAVTDPDAPAHAWCDQQGSLSGGDQGSPGRRNSDCG